MWHICFGGLVVGDGGMPRLWTLEFESTHSYILQGIFLVLSEVGPTSQVVGLFWLGPIRHISPQVNGYVFLSMGLTYQSIDT
jgi:hypothetical protein